MQVVLSPEVELAGRDAGDVCSGLISLPKNPHFFADRGVRGPVLVMSVVSVTRGIESRLARMCDVVVVSSWTSAVSGRSMVSKSGMTIISRDDFASGDENSAEIIEDMELLTECPGLTVLALSDDTIESGRGIVSTLSENATRTRLAGREVTDLSSGLIVVSIEEAVAVGSCCSTEGDVGAEAPPFLILGSGLRIMLRSWQDMAADLR